MDNRLKQGENLLERLFPWGPRSVRSIRASERRIWLQITDILQKSPLTMTHKYALFKAIHADVQNKFHYGNHCQTAAEIIYRKQTIQKTTWDDNMEKKPPNGRILQADTK